MSGISGTGRWPSERQLMRMLLLACCILILYGSFIPFHFSTDRELLRSQLSRAQLFPYQAGVKNFSIPDLMSNILLFVPFGALVVGAGLRALAGRTPWASVAVAGGCGLGFGLAIEVGQVFAPGRTASPLDTICDALGAAGGAYLGHFLLRSGQGRLGALVSRLPCDRPAVVLLAFVALAPMADAFYPYELTLDVSTAWGNLKRTQWIPFRDGPHRFLGDLIVEKVFLFAVLGDLARRSLGYRDAVLSPALRAWLLTTCFAASLEGGKLFFVGRAPNAENFLLGSLGALVGILLVPLLARTPLVRKRPVEVLLGLALLLIAYEELSPFTWAASLDAVAAKASRIEWLPLASYYRADRVSALFDLGKKVFLVCPLGFLVAARRAAVSLPRRQWIPAVWGLGIGTVLEASQLLQMSRIPSMTDVLVFGASAWAGAALFALYGTIVGGP